ncbi:MAG TPA: MFS transporter [Burkholderiales bacterium]|nr:MFS transporter [Burkholderiales bacterium]
MKSWAIPHAILIPLIVACALFMENMDSTVIATALPAIAKDIGENPLALKLALTSYLVSLAVFIPISGWMADRFGSRSVFAAAIIVFTGGSLLCAGSSTLAEFVVARFLQGMGGAMMVPVGRLVLLRSIPKNELVAALNYITIPALLGPVIGPPLGGMITLYFHWRWIFLINVPISVIGLYLVLRHIPNLREPDLPPLDVRGFLLSGIGLSVLMLGLSALGGHLLSGEISISCIGLGALILWIYVWNALRNPHPLINFTLLKLPTFHTGVVGGGLFRIGVGATPFLLPLLLQIGFGLDPLHSGLLTAAAAAGALFMKTLTTAILRRYGFRSVLTLNAVASSAVLAAYGLFTAATPHFIIIAMLLFGGCLRSLQFTALGAISYADVDREAMSQATSFSSMAQQLTQSLGVAVGAYALQLSSVLHGHQTISASDFWPAFLAVAIISSASLFIHAELPPGAGSEVSGHTKPQAQRAVKSEGLIK